MHFSRLHILTHHLRILPVPSSGIITLERNWKYMNETHQAFEHFQLRYSTGNKGPDTGPCLGANDLATKGKCIAQKDSFSQHPDSIRLLCTARPQGHTPEGNASSGGYWLDNLRQAKLTSLCLCFFLAAIIMFVSEVARIWPIYTHEWFAHWKYSQF